MTILSIIFLAFSARADQPSLNEIMSDIPPRVVASAHRYAVDIVNWCPPQNCMVISAGLTNTLIDAFVRNEMKTRNISDTYIRYWPYTDLRQVTRWHSDDRDEWLVKNFPSKSEVAGKRVLLLRTLVMGKTMQDFLPMLRDFLSNHGYDCKIDPYFIADVDIQFNFDLLKPYLGRPTRAANNLFVTTLGWRKEGEGRHGGYSVPIESYYRFLPVTIDPIPHEFWKGFSLRENLKSEKLDSWVGNYVRQTRSARANIQTSKNFCSEALAAP